MQKNGINISKFYTDESDFQSDAINLIKQMGGYVIKVHVASYESQGEPDLVCCYKGLFVAFELKVKKNKPTALQTFKIHQIQRAGGIAKAVWTLKEIEETLYEIFRIQSGGKPK